MLRINSRPQRREDSFKNFVNYYAKHTIKSVAFLYLKLNNKYNFMNIKYISLSVAFMLFSISMIAQSKVGTVNVNEILTNLPEIVTVEKTVATYNGELEKTLNGKVTIYKTKLDLYKKNASTYSDIMKKTMGEELYNLENDIKKFQQNGSQLTKLKQDDLLRPLYKKISDMIAVVAKEQSYTQILTVDGNEFAYADEKFDITTIVKTKLGIPAK